MEIEKLIEALRHQAETIRGTNCTTMSAEQSYACADALQAQEYTILGIMHSVDKWLDGDELKADEVNRAATMREKTLQIVERLTAQLTEKETQLAAAMEDIKRFSAQTFEYGCWACAKSDDGGRCRATCFGFEWRGPQEAGEGGG